MQFLVKSTLSELTAEENQGLRQRISTLPL
jgi:hypothetical protein